MEQQRLSRRPRVRSLPGLREHWPAAHGFVRLLTRIIDRALRKKAELRTFGSVGSSGTFPPAMVPRSLCA